MQSSLFQTSERCYMRPDNSTRLAMSFPSPVPYKDFIPPTPRTDLRDRPNGYLWGCNRAGNLSWAMELDPGTYELEIGYGETKWNIFPVDGAPNNGRAFNVYIQGEIRDVVDAIARANGVRVALSQKYCVTVGVDRTLRIDTDMYHKFTYGPEIAWFEVRRAPATCKHSIFDFYGKNYDYPGPGGNWIYAINGAGTNYLSSDGIFFAGDYGYFYGFKKDASNLDRLMWHGEMFYNLCGYELACSGSSGCGQRNWYSNFEQNLESIFLKKKKKNLYLSVGKFSALDATPNDKFLFIQQRYGRDFRYKLPVPTPGWHFIVLLTTCPVAENRNFEVRFEEGEGANHEAAFTVRVRDAVLARYGGTGNENAGMFGFYVNVRGRFLDIRFNANPFSTDIRPNAAVSALLVRKALNTGDVPTSVMGLQFANTPVPPQAAPSCVASSNCTGLCGLHSTGCEGSGTVDCGSCPLGQFCTTDPPGSFAYGDFGECRPVCVPTPCGPLECGSGLPDGCGGVRHCGECAGQSMSASRLCVANQCPSPRPSQSGPTTTNNAGQTAPPNSTVAPTAPPAPCQVVPFVAQARVGFERLTLSLDVTPWECITFLNQLAPKLGVSPTQIQFHLISPSPVVVEFSAPTSVINSLVTNIKAGPVSGLPPIISATDSQGNIIKSAGGTTSSGSMAWIAGVVIGVLVVAAVVTVITVLVIRRQSNGGSFPYRAM